MLKYFSLLIVFAIASQRAMEKAMSSPLPLNYRYPQVQNPNIDEPLCYMQIGDGTTLDLQKICNKKSLNNSIASKIYKAKFRQGSGKAYAPDSQ